MTIYLDRLNNIVWGAPALVLILVVGLYLSFRLGFVQLTLLPAALRAFFQELFRKSSCQNGTSGFQALCTALAGTVGTGNLVGVAGAICLGGPGAIFWMWLCGILGMATKLAEVVLAVCYREISAQGPVGGPMYVISRGLGSHWRWLASFYSLCGVIAAFGVGNAAQINAVVTSVGRVMALGGRQADFSTNLGIGLLLAVLIGRLLLGGAKKIGDAAQRLVPITAAVYILLCVWALLCRADKIPEALQSIVTGAFAPRAVTGGMLGSTFQALRVGCSRGVFTNEAGMGTASIAHASANVSHPVQQGLMGIVEVFLDTIVICSLTALVILVSDVPISYGIDVGAELTVQAFEAVYGKWSSVFLAVALSSFGVATVLGWGLYGARCADFLFGPGAWKKFAVLQTLTVVLSSVLDTGTVWQISEIMNGLMAIPNLIALGMLTPEVVYLTKEYRKSGVNGASGGKYENFYQCKSL